MITIRPIRQEEVPAAKGVILTVANNIFGFEGCLEDSIHHHLAAGKLKEMDEVHAHYCRFLRNPLLQRWSR